MHEKIVIYYNKRLMRLQKDLSRVVLRSIRFVELILLNLMLLLHRSKWILTLRLMRIGLSYQKLEKIFHWLTCMYHMMLTLIIWKTFLCKSLKMALFVILVQQHHEKREIHLYSDIHLTILGLSEIITKSLHFLINSTLVMKLSSTINKRSMYIR